jgi:hypothetical protein
MWIGLTVLVTAVVGVGAWIVLSWRFTIVPIDDVASVYVHPERNEEDHPGFTVPEEHWQELFDALMPYKVDLSPAKWESYRDVTITLNDGSELTLFLFRADGEAAFAMGKSWEDRTYYRGGSDHQLAEVIDSLAK